MQIPAGWSTWTDQERLAYADEIINYGQRLASVGSSIRASVEKAQETIANMENIGLELTAQQILQIRNKFVAENAAAYLALPDSIPIPGA